MAKRARYQNRIELLQGTPDLLVLQTLQWGPQHGYNIAQAIRASSSDVLPGDPGSVSRALPRPPPARAAEPHRRLVEALGEQAADARLPADRRRPAPARLRAVEVGSA